MATHFKDYEAVEGQVTACGRKYPSGKRPRPGVVVTTQVGSGLGEVTCQSCIGSERYRLARTRLRRPLDDPRGVAPR